MNIQQILQSYFKTNPVILTPFERGLTNKNYLTTVNGITYVVRIPSEVSSGFIDRFTEQHVQNWMDEQALGIKACFFDADTGIKISVYQENLEEFGEFITEERVRCVAKLLRRLHQDRNTCGKDFDAVGKLFHFASFVSEEARHPSEQAIIEATQALDYQPQLCHNDLVSGNLLFDSMRVYLIDYEYAADNDPLFDLISFLSENNITDTRLRTAFYSTYFEKLTPEFQHRLDTWEKFQNLLWYYWALMMHKEQPQDIYVTIAQEKLSALEACLDKKPTT
ncbi:MAG: phosphotransferase, partial [Erysipelotrichaceae bacterium]